jgi:hypothetical protein
MRIFQWRNAGPTSRRDIVGRGDASDVLQETRRGLLATGDADEAENAQLGPFVEFEFPFHD